ncbi:NrsF family protein [Donghicola sp. XS_ASV15]|uniref:NrsF family protein n=1 Tax=Donghicola sp. XS_ASV15 TaxID=3241295 RepID=UPI003511D788
MTTPQDTDAFIADLAARPAPEPLDLSRAAGWIGVALAMGLGGILAILGIRADLGAALQEPVTLAKNIVPLLLAGLALPFALSTSRPAATPPLWMLIPPALVAVALFVMQLSNTQPAAIGTEIMGQTAAACLVSITAISALPLIAGIRLLRKGATTRPTRTGALLGLAIGGLAAAGYALHCDEDSPLFYVTWYGLAIFIATGIGAFAGHRYLRW